MIPRYIIFAAMFAVGFVLLQNWSNFTAEKAAENRSSVQPPIVNGSDDIPTTTASGIAFDENATQTVSAVSSENLIEVETDRLIAHIDLKGGDVVYAALKEHKSTLGSDEPFVVLENNNRRHYILQSGLIGQNGTDTKDGRPLFTSAQKKYSLSGDSLNVDLVLQQDGVNITKRFVFTKGSYLINLDYQINNTSATQWNAAFYGQIKRDDSVDPASETGGGGLGLQPFLGFATQTNDKRFDKYSFKDITKKTFEHEKNASWIALIQHYFLSAWIPQKDIAYKYSMLKSGSGKFIGRTTGPVVSVAAGSTANISNAFYVGPKDQYQLEKIAPGLDLSVDYSFLWWVAKPLYSLLNFFATGHFKMFGIDKQLFSGFGNWGVAIILLTILVKALFFKLNQKAYRSMANMKRFAPKMQSIKDRYPDDRQKQSKAMMDLYKKEQINPVGGCLPMLVQMPVFLALYWVLMESVELRHAPFMLWIQDLSAKDSLFILPILMGISMFFQQKLNPKPADPMQAKVMGYLPIIFTFFFLFFPAGLVLYWVVNNILSISQQWYITRQIAKENEGKAVPS
ncbi:MAG: membrane protein insertase YidC [Pseudomonadota bacterium]